VVWLAAGRSCDGDSVAVTAAEQPSIEDVLLGAIPGLPKVHLHNPVLAYEVGDEFMQYFYQAAEGEMAAGHAHGKESPPKPAPDWKHCLISLSPRSRRGVN